MKLLTMLFGKWEVIRSVPGEVEYASQLFNRKWEEKIVLTIERNTRTQKERAFIHRLNGTKKPTSLELAKVFIAKVTP